MIKIIMYYVYLIKSKNNSYKYIGSTPDLERRIKEHNIGKVDSTKKYIPYDLVYYEAYKNKVDAIKREKNLKQYGSAYGHLKKRLKSSLI